MAATLAGPHCPTPPPTATPRWWRRCLPRRPRRTCPIGALHSPHGPVFSVSCYNWDFGRAAKSSPRHRLKYSWSLRWLVAVGALPALLTLHSRWPHAALTMRKVLVELLLWRLALLTPPSSLTPRRSGYAAAHLAARNGHCGVVRMLAGAGAELNSLALTHAPLHLASQEGHAAAVEALLAAGADPNKTGGRERASALWFAAKGGHEASAAALLAAGGEAGAVDMIDQVLPPPAAAAAAAAERARCPEYDHFATSFSQRSAPAVQESALHWAARGGWVPLLTRLLAAGAAPAAKNRLHYSPLNLCSGAGVIRR